MNRFNCSFSHPKNTVDTMKSFIYVNRLAVLTLLCAGSLLGCSQEENPTTVASLELLSTPLGQVITGDAGKTLYFFAGDAAGMANCTGGCASTWPIFYQEIPIVGKGLKASDFNTITRADGNKQTTFKGWPLYYFSKDTKAGDVAGENVGNAWMVAKTNYTLLLASQQLVGNDGKNYTFDTKEGTGNSLFLVDSIGRTLYAFANDRHNINKYTKADLSNNGTWPIFEISAPIGEIPSALKRPDFTTITAAGKTQLTYKGWPLYYFGSDQGVRGNTKGVSVPRPGVWPVVNATSPEAPN
jgi:predicted lipoprotein with Yx(FWY)xxD motif